jgi:predicted metal-dependent peptidase
MKVLVVIEQKEIDPRVIEQAKKRMEWIIGFMVIRYHFVYQILGIMTKLCIPYMGTMGVRVLGGGRVQLAYDPEFVNSLKDEELTYILFHETLHIALHHCTTRNFDDHNLGNIATDLAVNEIIAIEKGTCEPPVIEGKLTGCFVSEFKKSYKDLKEKETAEYYYDYLREKQKQQQKQKKQKGEPGDGKGNGEPGDGKGNGKGEPDLTGDDSNPSDGQGQAKKVQKGKGGKDKTQGFDDHGGWKEDEVSDEIIRGKVNEIAKCDTWGNLGGAEKELILAAQTRRVNWRNLLRQFYGNMIWHEKESTRKRPNRRTGLIHPGTRKIQVDRHLVVVDTSGSVGSDLLAQFLATINQMTEYVPIDLMQCDCEITEPPRPFDSKQKEFKFSGRGGTCFQPIMDLVNERHYKSVVILTDGEAAECTEPKARVVWVLPEGHKPPVEWGMRVIMTRH